MNWIKQNTFIFGLIVTTVVGAIVLWVVGSSAAGHYTDAKDDYQTAFEEASRFETLDPYPTAENLEAKKIAVQDYAEQARELQKAFAPYRPESLENISPQAFSSALKEANQETRAAFGKDVVVPESYFCGFEIYRNALPTGNATGVLNYQLAVIKQMMLNLAESGASELVSLHRARLFEEENKRFKPDGKQVARKLPMEVVFKGPEASYRQFLSSLVNDKENYLVVRSVRVANQKARPPRKSDAQFERRARRPQGGDNNPVAEAPDFNALFNPGEGEPQPAAGGGEGEAPAEGAAEPAPAPAPAPEPQAAIDPSDTSRILSQVLGNEEVEVFVRVDLLLFLEAKELK